MVLVVNPNKLPVKDAKELAAALKAKPGVYNYASSGNGTILHLAARDVPRRRRAPTSNHIPYKGVGPMITDLHRRAGRLGGARAAVRPAAT